MNKDMKTNATATHFSNRMHRAMAIMEEAVFIDLWMQRQRRFSGLNGGYSLLDLLLNEKDGYDRVQAPGQTETQRLSQISEWTARDARVAASVIQWLGTKEGAIFIAEAEMRIAKQKKRDQENHHRVNNLGLPPLEWSSDED